MDKKKKFSDKFHSKHHDKDDIDNKCDTDDGAQEDGLNPEINHQTKEESQSYNIKSLQEQIIKLENDIVLIKDAFIREKAEGENTKRRHTKEIEDTSKYVITNFAKDLIEIAENLYRAEDHIPEEFLDNLKIKTVLEGTSIIMKLLKNVFDKYGIIRLYPKGEMFDHNYHQAISQSISTEVPENTILEVIQAGYLLKDRLLRPAMVMVAKNPE